MKKLFFLFTLFICLCCLQVNVFATSPAAKLTADGTHIGTYESVQEAVDAITTSKGNNFIIEISAGTVSHPLNIIQQPNKNVVVRPEPGSTVFFTDTITIDGNGNLNSPETLLIQDLSFDFTSAGAPENCIYFNNIPPRVGHSYAHNVTINGCKFAGVCDTTVAVQSMPGGSKNISILNSTATNMHSLAQLKTLSGYAIIKNCTLRNSGGGVNFYGTGTYLIDNCTLDVEGYAVRSGQSSGTISNTDSVNINNCIFNSNSTDDGTIVLRGDSTGNINIFHSNITNANGAIIQNLNPAGEWAYKIKIVESNISGQIIGINSTTISAIDDENVQNGPVCIKNGMENSFYIAILFIILLILLIVISVYIKCACYKFCKNYNNCG